MNFCQVKNKYLFCDVLTIRIQGQFNYLCIIHILLSVCFKPDLQHLTDIVSVAQ